MTEFVIEKSVLFLIQLILILFSLNVLDTLIKNKVLGKKTNFFYIIFLIYVCYIYAYEYIFAMLHK
jgi:hypothetical protein